MNIIYIIFSVPVLLQNAICGAAKPAAAKPAENSNQVVKPIITIDKSSTIASYLIKHINNLAGLTGKTYFDNYLKPTITTIPRIIKNLEDLIDVIKKTNSSEYPKIVKFKLALLAEIDSNPLVKFITLSDGLEGWYCTTPQEIIRNIILDPDFKIEDELPENIKVFIKQYRFNRWQYIKNYCDNKDNEKKLRRNKGNKERKEYLNQVEEERPFSMKFLIKINDIMGDPLFSQSDLIDPFDFIVPEKPKEINEEDIKEMENNMNTIDKYDSDFYFDMYPKDFKYYHSQHKNDHFFRKLNIVRKGYPNKVLSRNINPNEDFSDAEKYPDFAKNVDSAMDKNRYYRDRLYIYRQEMNYLRPQNELTVKKEEPDPQNELTVKKEEPKNKEPNSNKAAYLLKYDELGINNYYFSRAIMTFFNWRDHYCYNLEKKDKNLDSPDKEWTLEIDEMYLDKMNDKKKGVDYYSKLS